MDRIDKILNHNLFLLHMKANKEAEADRRFCLHNIEHLLDVSRVAMIINLQENLNIDREIIYAAALLHDIGRHVQYKENIPHEVASVAIAKEILDECDFSKEETLVILNAISAHREIKLEKSPLGDILYRADKESRPCFFCKVRNECNWPDEKKNISIKW